jgi:uncharacterized protein (DUF433 family)
VESAFYSSRLTPPGLLSKFLIWEMRFPLRVDRTDQITDVLPMSVQTDVEIGQMITRTPGILGGKPCIMGHRVGVHRVAGWWKSGLTVEEIGERLSTLTPAEIHVALAYYHLHRNEIERYLEEERMSCGQAEQKSLTPL